jgi:glycosyltransferase involved in cell wall biosynthesis
MLAHAKALDIADRLVMPGVTDDVLSAMSLMDMLVLTSYGEGLPNVLLEAQWVGTPVVATDAGGAREAIDPGVTGWIVQDARASQLAEVVLRVAGDQAWRTRAREASPSFVRDKFSIEHMIRATLQAYALDASFRRRGREVAPQFQTGR